MIIAQVIGDKALVAKLNAAFGNSHADLKRTIGRLALELAKHIKRDKLSGQVLNVRTGRLRRSIHTVVQSDATSIIGKVGTDVVYAAYHEFGFSGTETVRAHLRRAKDQMAFSRKMKKSAYISKQEGTINVRSHTRTVNYPERSFLRTALKDMEPYIKEQIDSGLRTSIRRSMGK